jgi:hypothetical protein
MEILELVDTLKKEEIRELLNYLKPINEAGLLKEFIYRIDPNDIVETMHHVYYDLLIDPETGKFKEEFKNIEI